MIKKRITAILLSTSLCLTGWPGLTQPAPAAHAAAAENKTRDHDPWSMTVLPQLQSVRDASADQQTKFTHMEWTGEQGYVDAAGDTVNAADVYRINVQDATTGSTFSVPYESVDKAIDGAVNYRKEASGYVQYLTGEQESNWELTVVQNQEQAQWDEYRNFYEKNYAPPMDGLLTDEGSNHWRKDLTLPASWTHYGYDKPIYANVQMPWQTSYDRNVKSPNAPVNYNPVGLYRKTFDVKDTMLRSNGRVYISFQGVEACYYVYVNGKEVGYSEDSFSPHSFDITDYLTADGRDNLLAVEVHKFCDGTWMEGQDMIYDGGIFRDVYLYSTPLIHIQDYTVITDLDDNYKNADLNVNLTVSNNSNSDLSNYAVDIQLFNPDGSVFMNGYTIDIPAVGKAGSDGSKTTVAASGSRTIYEPALWSAEQPNLYTMVLTLYDKSTGAYIESVSQQLGFREIEFVSTEVDANGQKKTPDSEYQPMTINGQPLLLKGTNRHDTDPVYGKYVPKDTVRQDIETMKRFNLNAVRTSHYSNDEYLYYLCDKYGLYVMGETNVESHALMNKQKDQKHFKNMVMDRTITAFQRLKNRTSVVMWSTGNENYYSSSKSYADGMFYDLIQYFKEQDPTRPVHCESSGNQNGVDMDSNMYPTVGTVEGKAKANMPYVLCEYDHAMGNAVGNIKEYWDAIRSSDNMLGGFIWDWVDQSRLTRLPKNGYDYYAEPFAHKTLYADQADGFYYAYGGDWKDNPNDGSFCVNGLVSPDRDVQPELYEVKYIYQNFWFTADDLELSIGKINVYNESSFDDMNRYNLVWKLYEDDTELASGTECFDVSPREETQIELPYLEKLPDERKAGAEYYLTLELQLKSDELYAGSGHVVAHEQFLLPETLKTADFTPSAEKVQVQEDSGFTTVTGTDFSFRIDNTTGILQDYTYRGSILMTKGPAPNFYRAPLNNDGSHDRNWKAATENQKLEDIETGKTDDGRTLIRTTLSYPKQPELKVTITYTVNGDGALTVAMTTDATASSLKNYLRIGTQMRLPQGYENVTWYGGGPVESMSDRNNFATIGKYQTTVSGLFYPYLDTQDTGTLTGVKWFTVTDPAQGAALVVAGRDDVEASALHFTVDDLTAARHPYQLHPEDDTILSVNLASQGTGNKSCGPDTLAEYLLPNNKEYSYEYTLIPYDSKSTANLTELTRSYRNVSVYEGNPAIRAFEKEVRELVVYSYSQLPALLDLRARYEGDPSYDGDGSVLTAAEKAAVSEEIVLLLNQKIDEASALENNSLPIEWTDLGINGFTSSMNDDSHYIPAYDQEENVSYIRGYLDLDSDEQTKHFETLFQGSQPFTLEAYINMNDSTDDMNVIFGKGDRSVGLRGTTASLYFFIHNGTEWQTCEASGLYIAGWHHVAAMYSPDQDGTLSIALDGRIVQQKTGVGSVSAAHFPLGIGHDADTGRAGDNSFAAVRIYNRTLSEEELRGQMAYDLGAAAEPAVAPQDEAAELWYEFSHKPVLLHLSRTKLSLTPNGPSDTIRAEIAPRNYRGASLSASSENESIVSVKTGENGQLELIPGSEGETTIRVQTDGGLYNLCRVTVKEKKDDEETPSPAPPTPPTPPAAPSQPGAPSSALPTAPAVPTAVPTTPTTAPGGQARSAKAKPKKPVIRSLKKSGRRALLKWKKCKADSIEIYVRTGKGKFKKAATKKGTATSYKTKKLKAKTKYTFKIRAVNRSGKKKVYSAYSKTKTIRM